MTLTVHPLSPPVVGRVEAGWGPSGASSCLEVETGQDHNLQENFSFLQNEWINESHTICTHHLWHHHLVHLINHHGVHVWVHAFHIHGHWYGLIVHVDLGDKSIRIPQRPLRLELKNDFNFSIKSRSFVYLFVSTSICHIWVEEHSCSIVRHDE